MSISPIITFKAGKCELDHSTTPPRVKALPTPGYIYLYIEDELVHFCWRPRSASLSDPDLDLVMIPTDGSFTPYQPSKAENSQRPTNGRIFVLKFSSSSQRHLFWLQSKSQDPQGDPAYFSARDKRLGEIVNQLLQGEEIDVDGEVAALRNGQEPNGDGGDAMEDVQGTDQANEHQGGGSGGAGADATGGDVREEGEESREGGADGGRAAAPSLPQDASAIVQNFLNSLKRSGGAQPSAEGKTFTTLPDLLPSSITIPATEAAPPEVIDSLLHNLPPEVLVLAQESSASASESEATAATAEAAVEALSQDQKKDILRRVLRSPQFHQSLASLTVALRDGGLPSISEALGIPVENGGFIKNGTMPMGGGEAVEAFLEGVKRQCEGHKRADGGSGRGKS